MHDAAAFVDGLDAIVHLAHTNTPLSSNEDLPADAEANLIRTLSLIQAIRDAGSSCHIVYASSGGALYAPNTDRRLFRETDPCLPTTSYGIQKLATEHYLRFAVGEGWLTATALRIGNAYGALLPRERRQGFIGVAVNDHAHSQPIRLFGNPDNVRDYVHLDDVCAAIESALKRRESFRTYNIGSGEGTSVRAVLDLLERISERTVRTEVESFAEAQRLPEWAVLDSSLAAANLGWIPRVALQEGIRRLWCATVES